VNRTFILEELIPYLRSLDEPEYDQRELLHPCGTPACLAGHTAFLAGLNLETTPLTKIMPAARRALGVSQDISLYLFDSEPVKHYKIDAGHAIKMLEWLLEQDEAFLTGQDVADQWQRVVKPECFWPQDLNWPSSWPSPAT
jgi:hypothetical protein